MLCEWFSRMMDAVDYVASYAGIGWHDIGVRGGGWNKYMCVYMGR